MTAPYILYSTPTSYYGTKLKAYLLYKAIPFEERLTTAEVYRDVILPRTGVWMIPTMIAPDDEALQDTTAIWETLEARFPEPPVEPATPRQRIAANLLELFCDEWMITVGICYRWTIPENKDWITREFGRQMAPEASAAKQFEKGAEKVAFFSNWVNTLGIGPATRPAIVAMYEGELLPALQAHFAEMPFLFGTRPSIADFALMGPLGALLGRDPVSRQRLQQIAPKVTDWIERMRTPKPLSGDFLPADEIPPAVVSLLRLQARDQLPEILDCLRLLPEWVAEHPGEILPKTVGWHRFTIDGVAGERAVHPYPQWMLQRILEKNAALDPAGRAAVAEMLRAAGAPPLDGIAVPQPIARIRHRLVPLDPAGQPLAEVPPLP